ncbi:MAG TPA: MFS transporter [Candidatus Aminicenantes bacterium]|nr:MFS transporter [Candidatus Aminicenantes bacterium]HRY65986.1 MFS transporter [Candidatus Aminicenantes bacterium]HRZ72965.1 MFS transporter [Candidatus Aminicenantes bacterium]
MSRDHLSAPPPLPRPGLLGRILGLRRQMSWSQTFTALRYRNYRLWFWSQIVSLFGTWMESTAMGFLIFELTKSPAYLGLVGFVSGVPTWLFMLYAGVIADRVPRRRVLIITQSVMMGLAFGVAALTFLHWIRPWHILIMAFLLGTANAFDAPARQSFVLEMVDREDMTNAIALNAAMFNSAMAIGPAAGGLIYGFFGPGWCFAVNGASFIAVIFALRRMTLAPFTPPAAASSVLADLRNGLKYVAHHPLIRTIIGLLGLVSLFGVSFVTIFPAWAVNVLHGDAKTNGFLQSARGLGALIAALLIASLGRFRFRGKLLTFGTFALPIMAALFALVRWTPLSLVLVFGAGLAQVLIFNMSNALVQTHSPDSLRGRIMGVYTLVFFGFMPLGALWIGLAAQHLSQRAAVLIGAGLMLAAAAGLAVFMPHLRRQA